MVKKEDLQRKKLKSTRISQKDIKKILKFGRTNTKGLRKKLLN